MLFYFKTILKLTPAKKIFDNVLLNLVYLQYKNENKKLKIIKVKWNANLAANVLKLKEF